MYTVSRPSKAKQTLIQGVLFGAGLVAGLVLLQALFLIFEIAMK